MTLADFVTTFGQDLLQRHGERVHKLAINASFTCPNRDGTKGRGGCSFFKNVSFRPPTRQPNAIPRPTHAGRVLFSTRTGAVVASSASRAISYAVRKTMPARPAATRFSTL